MIRSSALVRALCILSLAVVVHARQGAPPALKPLVPAAASSIAQDPEAFYGQTVSVTATVDELVSPTSFTVDQVPKKPGRQALLVIVDVLTAPLAVNSSVTVIGEVVRHDGRPAIRATSVITTAMVDIAKRLPPPMTADEAAFDQVMKRIGPAFAALGRAAASGGGEGAAANAVTVRQGFLETEAFWKKRDRPDAMKWAVDARTQSEVIERAVAAGKWDDVKTATAALQQSCSACHGAYRERQDDGSYRLRMVK